MSNEIIPTGNAAKGLNFWQSRELAKIETDSLLEAGKWVARNNVESLKEQLAHGNVIRQMRHTEERGGAAIQAANRLVDSAIEAVGDSEIHSHHISKILSKATNKLAEQV